MMEAGAVGNQLSLKVWPVGSEEPTDPQLVIADNLITSGVLGVTTAINRFSIQSPTIVQTSYDNLEFTPVVPEPSSAFLGVVAMLSFFAGRRRPASPLLPAP